MSVTTAAPAAATPGVGGVPFNIASRPQRRYSIVYNGLSNLGAGGSFPVTQLSATGWVRKIQLLLTATYTTSASAAVVSGDSPWNLISGITLTDATGQPVVQPISGYGLYLINKYLPAGTVNGNGPTARNNQHLGPGYAYSATGTAGSAVFRLNLDFEQDAVTGYGCIPNLDSNASLQLKVDYAASTVAFSGGTASAATLSMRVTSWYWAPVASTIGGAPVSPAPPGGGDYLQTRYETQTATPSAENLLSLTNRGGLIKGMLIVSRAAGVRTAFTAGANVGLILDNQPIDEGVPLEEVQDAVRRAFTYFGNDVTTSYAPVTADNVGLDNGVLPILPWMMTPGSRAAWLKTVVGSLLQVRVTPGASASGVEIYTQLMQVKDAAAFYAR